MFCIITGPIMPSRNNADVTRVNFDSAPVQQSSWKPSTFEYKLHIFLAHVIHTISLVSNRLFNISIPSSCNANPSLINHLNWYAPHTTSSDSLLRKETHPSFLSHMDPPPPYSLAIKMVSNPLYNPPPSRSTPSTGHDWGCN